MIDPLVGGDFGRGAGGGDAPAVAPGAWADVDDVVGGAQDVEVVLDDQDGVA